MQIDRRSLLGASAIGIAFWGSGCSPTQDTNLNEILDRIATNILRESPEFATSLAVTEERAGGSFIDRLSDVSREGLRRQRAVNEAGIVELQSLNRATLQGQDAVSYDVVTTALQNTVDAARFEYGGGANAPYVVNQISGA